MKDKLSEKMKELLKKREYYREHPEEALRDAAKREDNVVIFLPKKPEKK